MTSTQNIKTPKKGSALYLVLQYLKSKGSPATKSEILNNCDIRAEQTVYNLVTLYPHLVKKIESNVFQYVESYKGKVYRRDPSSFSLEERACQFLKTQCRPVNVKEIWEHCGFKNNTTVALLPQKYPHLVTRVRRGVYQYVGPIEGDQQQELIKTAPESIAAKTKSSPFSVPVSRVLNNAKLNRPALQRLSDEELIRRHLITNAFQKGVDYVGDDLAKIKLTYRASLKLATMLGSPETRSQIEEAKSAAEGQDHIRSFDLESLMPDGAPEGFPVSFDALIEALGLNRRKAMRGIHTFVPTRAQKSVRVKNGHPKDHYWLTEHGAKRFVLESGISSARKAPIYDYFIRREPAPSEITNSIE